MTDTTASRCETEMPHMSSPRRPVRVVIPGGAGHLGRIVAGHLHARGNAVTVLSRSGAVAPWQIVSWNGADPDDWERELEDTDVVINLAGRSVNCRYNRNNRREILESRIRTTELLGEAISKLHRPPRLWVNASTATIYRHSLDREMDEANGKLGGQEPDVPDSWRFSIEVATSWERTLFAATTPHTRKIALRSAMVMSAERGGTFDILLRLVRFGLGGACGSGKQFVSWIHEDDFVRALDYLVAQKFILHWGEMGTRWGINRTVAQVHALLFVAPKPLPADEISTTLAVARSNVSTSLRELQGWGIVRVVHVLGDRRDHFESIKDVWEIFRIVSEERKRREIDPTLRVLAECVAELKAGPQGDAYTRERFSSMLGFFA